APEETVFLSRDGARLSRTDLQARLRSYGQRIGLEVRLRPHVPRHTCATHTSFGVGPTSATSSSSSATRACGRPPSTLRLTCPTLGLAQEQVYISRAGAIV
ncbi:MAG: tyrosine-type recombinase/integrase, partial [Candidatus Methylomirabilis sp.]